MFHLLLQSRFFQRMRVIYSFFKKDKVKEGLSSAKYEPIVFVNKPICKSNDDVLFYSTQADSIISAVSQGANVIGVIADYGAGKTSLTQLLCFQDTKTKAPINIYLWDSLSTKSDSIGSNEIKPVAAITRSFLYQLACGDQKDHMFARNINWRLSRNFGVLSVSPTKKDFWYYVAAAAICFIAPKAALIAFPNLLEWVIFILNMLSPWGAVFIALCGLIRTNVAFSLWDSQGKRQPESSDTYSLFSEIVEKVFAENTRRYVFVEDLDRIKDKAVVIEFLKEIYKFNALLDDEYKKRVIFVISVMPENKLVDAKPESEYGQHLYSKIFDYSVVLPAIHIQDHESVLLDILKTHYNVISNILGEPLSNKMPAQLVWLIKGDNLTVRDIKNRLNICFSIYDRLKKRQDLDDSLDLDIQLGKCAAVAYLTDRYPDHISCLMQNEDGFDALVAHSSQQLTKNSFEPSFDFEIWDSIESRLVETLDDPKSVSYDLRKKLAENVLYSKNDELFQNDIIALLVGHFIEDDYHQYFYTYPKNSRIYKVYESRVRALISSNGAVTKDLLADISLVRVNSPEIIINKIQFILNLKTGLPSCVFLSKDLFEIVFENFPNEASSEIARMINWEPRKIEESRKLLYFLEADINSVYHKKLFEKLSVFLVEKLKDEPLEAITTARKELIQILGIDMIHFTQLYRGSNMPLIQTDEMALVRDPDLIIALTNIDLIDETSALKVSEWIDSKFDSQYFDDLEKIWGKCLSIDSSTAENAINYLLKNKRYNDTIFCSIIESEVCDDEDIVEYVNGISPTLISQKGWNLIDDHMIFGGYNDTIRKWLINKKKFKTYLLDLSNQDTIQPALFSVLDAEALRSALSAIFKYSPDRFMWLRTRLPGRFMRALPSLYHSPYPFVTDYELQKCSSLTMAISIINFTDLELKNCKYVASLLTKLSNGKLRCKKLFDEVFAREDIDIELRKSLFSLIDFSVVPFNSMTNDDQEECVLIVKELVNIETGRDALNTMRHLEAPIASLEEIISEDSSDEKEKDILISEYFKFIFRIKQFSSETINICRDHWLNIPMWEEFENALLACGEAENCLVSRILRTSSFKQNNLPPQIGLKSIVRVLTGVTACQRYIQSDKECLNRIMHDPEVYSYIDEDAIWFFTECRQTAKFIRYAFTILNDDEKLEYITSMADLDTKEEDRQFYIFMCEDENLKLAANSNSFRLRVGFRLYGKEDSKRKAQYFRKVKRLKETLALNPN